LTEQWQFGIRQTLTDDERKVYGEKPLAKGGNAKVSVSLPPHATISAYLLGPKFEAAYLSFNPTISTEIPKCIAHHHKPRASHFKKVDLLSDWSRWVGDVLGRTESTGIKKEEVAKRARRATLLAKGSISAFLPEFRNTERYLSYTIISRFITISDKFASAMEE